MKRINLFKQIILLTILLFVCQAAFPQSDNKLYIPTIESGAGKTASIPVYLNNESGIVALQFKLHIPDGFYIPENSSVLLSDRKNDHTLSVKNMGNNDYLFVTFSMNNVAFRGNSGVLLHIPVVVPDSCTDESIHPFSFNQVILSKITGDNVVTESDAGAIKIISEPRPDLTVMDIISSNNTVNPGNAINISWKIQNIGNLSTSSGWSEQISLVGDNSESVFLGTVSYNQLLDAGGVVSRNADFILPKYAGVEGEVKVMVKVIPNSSAGELPATQHNNTAKSNNYVSVGRSIFLLINKNSLAESDASPIPCQLFRSGSRATQQIFTLGVKNEGLICVPATVTIPANSSGTAFYISSINNQALNTDSFAIISASGKNYAEISDTIQIIDDEYPSLNIIASKSDLNEGETFTLTIERELVTALSLKINLSSEYSKRFSFTSDIVIPANEKSVTVNITTLDDAIPALTVNSVFTATAPGYNNGTASVSLADNDVPVITLSITPGSTSESAGYQSAIGIVSRQGATDNVITIKLTDNSNGTLYYSIPTIALEKGVAQKQFTIGVVDNSLVDGDKEFDITASVYISSCGCSAEGTGAGVVKSKFKILDDDGPALTISSSQTMLAEGNEQAALLTVTRNTDTTLPLDIAISTDHPEDLIFEHTTTIPAGSKSVTIPISVNNNSSIEGDRTATFTVQSEGYTKGICWAMITDQTLPDAIVQISSVSTNNALTKESVTANIDIKNQGVAPLGAGTIVSVYLCNTNILSASSARRLMSTLSTTNKIEVNNNATLTTSFTLPDLTGQYYLIAEINSDQTIKELSYLNNTSPAQPLAILPAYNVQVSTDKATYNQGETVKLTGKVTAQGNTTTNGVSVDIYIINNGYRQSLTATTDATGNFQTEFIPYSGQMGHFIVGACYPREGLSDEQTSFDIYGLRSLSGNQAIWEILENEQKNGEIEISNPGNIPLTGLKTTIISNPAAGTQLVFEALSDLAAGGTAKLKYTLTGTIASTGTQYDQIKFQVTTHEGATLDITGYYYCRSPRASLKANLSSIQTTMAKGETRTYPFTITNTGKGASGKINVVIPAASWLSLATPAEVPSLNYGESATVILQLTPTDDMAAHTFVTGTIGVNCENGDGFPLDFRIETVSEKTGILTVDVCDEYTYYTSAAPHLTGAKVVVKHPYTGQIYAEGTTDTNGLFSIDNLVEGYYTIVITADKHDSYTNNILIDPGKATKTTVNLSFQAITYTWNVVETEVEDDYEIETVVNYETNVPVPVVEMSAPSKIETDNLQTGESLIFNATLTNKGMITAKDVVLIMPEGFKTLTFEPLISDGFSLKPQESKIIPIKVTRTTGNDNSPIIIQKSPASTQDNIDDDPCVAYPGTLYFWDCGLDRQWHRYEIALQVGSCRNGNVPKDLEPRHQMTEEEFMDYLERREELNYLVAQLPTYTFNNGVSNTTIPFRQVDTGCEPCQNGMIRAGVQCAWHFVPFVEEIEAIVDVFKSFWEEIPEDEDFNLDDNEKEALKLLVDKIDWGKKILDFIENASTCYESSKNENEVLVENFLTCYTAFEDQIEEILEDNLDDIIPDKKLRQKVKRVSKKITKFIKKMAPVLDCLGDFVHACDHLESNKIQRSKSINASITPSYIQDFQEKVFEAENEIINYQKIFLEITGDECWSNCNIDELESIFKQIHNNKTYEEIVVYKPDYISDISLKKIIERWSNTITKNFSDGNYIDIQRLIQYHEIIIEAENKAKEWGYISMSECIEKEILKIQEKTAEASNSVCSSISLQLSQTMTMTRQAFRGTLTVFNGHESSAMQNVKLDLKIKDSNGNIVGSQLFQVNTENVDKLTAIDGTGLLDAQQTGTATILFIPTKYAAPTVSSVYSFGGTLSYLDPFTNTTVTRDLYPVTLTVKPSPDLTLDYFMQRDILGDDPLTTDVVEPSEPAEFSLLISNTGAGDATNVHFATSQPQIIQNDKGLLNEFKLTGSSMNGAEKTLNFSDNDFGTISADKTAYAQWWFTSNLLGHFVDYDTKITHVTSYDNPDLSLVSKVSIHELVRSMKISQSDGYDLTGFLANDITDAEDIPDILYLSNGTRENVNIITNASYSKISNFSYTMIVVPSEIGWNYGVFDDPGNGKLTLVSVIRQSDQTPIDLRNFWQTDRTLRDGKDPLYEYKIHFADNIQNTTETYLLTFEQKRNNILSVQSFSGIPENVATTQIENINVQFNKAIDALTFTSDDISLTCLGRSVDVSRIVINPVSETDYLLDLSLVPDIKTNGYFVLTVQTKNISDNEGYSGEVGKQANWKLFIDGKVQLTAEVQPVGSGNVTPGSGEFAYGELISFSAAPVNGYRFKNWTINKEIISTETVLNYPATEQKSIIANFEVKYYSIKILYNNSQGSVSGNSTGLFEFGRTLQLKANPLTGYLFVGWKVNDIVVENSTTLNVSIDQDATIEAVFRQKQTPEITWSNPSDIVFGTLLSELQLNATSSVAGTFSYSPLSGTKLNAGENQALTVEFTPDDKENYISTSKTVTINVIPAVLSCNESVILVSESANSRDVYISSNTNWTASSDQNWLIVTPVNGNEHGSLTLNVDANTGEERTAFVTVSSENVEEPVSIKIIQASLQTDLLNYNEQKVVLFPNPTSGEFMIKGLPYPFCVSLFDAQGTKLMTKIVEFDEPLSIKSLQTGLYLLKINNETNVFEFKLIKK